jgi:hypothetical protein
MKTPILLMVYIKPNTTFEVVKKLRDIRPSKIYISINTPPKENKLDLKKNLQVKKLLKK